MWGETALHLFIAHAARAASTDAERTSATADVSPVRFVRRLLAAGAKVTLQTSQQISFFLFAELDVVTRDVVEASWREFAKVIATSESLLKKPSVRNAILVELRGQIRLLIEVVSLMIEAQPTPTMAISR